MTMIGIKPLSAAIVLLGFVLGCEDKNTDQAGSASATPDSTQNPIEGRPSEEPSSPLTIVADRSLVCMVNNQYMGKPQIPIAVDGRTYYGCCEMCKGRLANDPTSRVSLDPVSGKQVDKATAVIGRDNEEKVLYFESEKTFDAYSRQASQ